MSSRYCSTSFRFTYSRRRRRRPTIFDRRYPMQCPLSEASQPCELTFRELAARPFRVFDGVFEVARTLQYLDHLTVADRPQGVRFDGNTGGQDPLNLLHKATRKKPFNARVESSIELFS